MLNETQHACWQGLLAEAHARYFQHACDGDLRWLSGRIQLTPATVLEWLSLVEHRVSARFTEDTHRYATAWYHEPLVTYNVHVLRRWLDEGPRGEARVLDMILHELGHLACVHFMRQGVREGHGPNWKALGHIVGYAPQGCMPDRQRDAWTCQVNMQRALRLAQRDSSRLAGSPQAEEVA